MRTQKPVPTLHDVAQAAGVSTATVSRCLNDPSKVVEETREKVLKAVADLGYSPNFGARVMAAKRTRIIGAIIPTMDNAIFARGLQAFQETLLEQGYTLILATTLYSPEQEAAHVRTLVAQGAEGLLLIGHDRDPSVAHFLATQKIPAIAAWVAREGAAMPSVGFNNRTAMRALADKVLGMGHRRLGMISAPIDGNDRARMRVVGVQQAMEAHGLDPDTLILEQVPYEFHSGADAFERLMDVPNRPTAVLCGNDVLAMGATTKARMLGISVPDDVSVLGFDDMDIAQACVPPLTTVRVPHKAMGQEAARLLVRMVEGGDAVSAVALDAEIVERASLAPPSGD